MNDVLQRITAIIIGRFKLNGSENFDLNQELSRLDPVTERELNDEEKSYAKKEILKVIQYRESYDGAILVPVSVVSDPKGHEDWYDKWLEENNTLIESYYWKNLENFLSHELTNKYGAVEAGKIACIP